MEFKSMVDLLDKFQTEQDCIKFLESEKWPNNKVISPFDPTSKVYKSKSNQYKCKNTNRYFNVKTNTIFSATKIPLKNWFIAIYLLTSDKKGLTSTSLARHIGVTQPNALYILRKIRACFQVETELEGVIEADESFVGGKNKNRHSDKKVKNSQGRSYKDKTPVLGLLQRSSDGMPKKLKLIVIPSTSRKHMQPLIGEFVKKGSTFYSDEWHGYKGLDKRFNHLWIDHSKGQYVDGVIHTNTIEGFWGIFKRGIIGRYHGVSPKYLQLYANEYAHRYNTNHLKTCEIFTNFFQNIAA